MASLYLERDNKCPYVADEMSRNLFFQSTDISASQFEFLLERGWRHFGKLFFRPLCQTCQRCESIVVDVSGFKPSKSMKRLRSKNRDLRVDFQKATPSQEKVDLLNLFQRERTAIRKWELQEYTLGSYEFSFLGDFDWCYEMTIRSPEGELIGVSLMDITPHAQSSIYFYSHPDWSQRSLGTWSILQEIEYARAFDRHSLYLGLWNDEALSLAYKARFSPHKKQAYEGVNQELVDFLNSI